MTKYKNKSLVVLFFTLSSKMAMNIVVPLDYLCMQERLVKAAILFNMSNQHMVAGKTTKN